MKICDLCGAEITCGCTNKIRCDTCIEKQNEIERQERVIQFEAEKKRREELIKEGRAHELFPVGHNFGPQYCSCGVPIKYCSRGCKF